MKNKNQQFVVKKERLISINLDFYFLCKVVFGIFLLFGFFYITHYKHIVLYWNKEKKHYSLFFSLLVSGSLLLYLVGIGLMYSIESAKIKIPIVIFIIYLLVISYEYIGIGIRFNTTFDLLEFNVYESNSRKGMMFLSRNWYVFGIFWFIHLPFMSEKND